MMLGMPVYEGVNLLDVAGPWEMFNWVDADRTFKTVIVSEDGRPVTTMNGITFEAHASFAKARRSACSGYPGCSGIAGSNHEASFQCLSFLSSGRRRDGQAGVLRVRRCSAACTCRATRRPQGDDALGILEVPPGIPKDRC
jgi:transcriptional regulator GlxA family with amidase domain